MSEPAPKLTRGFSLLQASALNMSNMVGVGPFLTIPMIIASMGGPQCMLGWLLGTVLALCDGLIWSELAAAMPGAGGTYVYFKEVFGGTALGRLLPFLFIWQFIFSGPLEIASGYIGFAQYVTYFVPALGPWETRLIVVVVGAGTIALLYRDIRHVGQLTVILWAGMLVTVVWVIATGAARFDPKIAFDFPPGAFQLSRGFFLGLGGAMLIAMYDFLGYYDICYVAGEVRQPERVIPRSILIAVVVVALIYSVMNLSIIGVVPWREAMQSKHIASDFMERAYGHWAGAAITVMILWTSMTSCFALLLGYSRIPFAAAIDGNFFQAFGRLHPTGRFPHVSLVVIGVLSILAGMTSLDWVLPALLTARILVQFVGQIVAVHWLRRRRTDIARPFRIWLYPVPALVALVGWTYIFFTTEAKFILYGLGTIVAGVAAFQLWKRRVILP
ncbi:MAG: APC family permease [Bryobacteraceae bacterium]